MNTYSATPFQHQFGDGQGTRDQQQRYHLQETQARTQHSNLTQSSFQKITVGISTILFTIFNFFAALPFRIVRKILYFIEKAIRYILWINIKGLVSWVNMVYRFFAFFRVAKIIALLQTIAKTYFPEYTSVDFDRAEQNLSRFSLLMSKKNIDLINVDKFEKKVKKPTLFEMYNQKKGKRKNQDAATENIERQTKTAMARQQENGNQEVSPRLVRLSQSHEKLKKKESGQGSLGSGIRVEIPARERNVVFPDRDISPERYMKPIPKIGQYAFSDKSQEYLNQKSDDQIYEKVLTRGIPPYPTEKQSELAKESRHQLEKQLVHLRQKMQELIQDNTSYIKDLQDWLKQKSQTIMMTRTQNIELLQEMQELQKQNINKTSKLQHLQDKIREMEFILGRQKSQTGELCQQIVNLNEQIQTKSIQIIVLKDKINRNLRKFQQYENNTQETLPEQKCLETNSEETLEDKIALQKLKQQEIKTAQLAEQVQKVLKQEMDQLRTQPLEQKVEEMLIQGKEKPGTIEDEANLIMNDPRQAYGEGQSEQRPSSQEGKKLRKSSQGRVIRSDGDKTITMRTE